MKIYIVLLLSLVFVGCASSPIKMSEDTETEIVEYPTIGKTVAKGLGDSIVAKGARNTNDAIDIAKATQFNKKEGESSIWTCAVTVSPGTFYKRGVWDTQSRKADCFGPVTYQLTLSDGSTNWNCPGIDGIADICRDTNEKYFLAVLTTQVELKQDHDNIRMSKKVVEFEDNFVQEIVYNGKAGNHLKFIYREFSDSVTRPAFTQEIQYDISESPIVNFKNVQLEVVQASNTKIVYKLINNF